MPDGDTIFRIASVSKIFAVCINNTVHNYNMCPGQQGMSGLVLKRLAIFTI